MHWVQCTPCHRTLLWGRYTCLDRRNRHCDFMQPNGCPSTLSTIT
ncbi:hypothetical protein ACFFX0_18355 [Citricoccus parietis]|uniref:Uncharacterized protein n=1 Tax=Citricoccus parietis TaxID=592307 RepID=A0ABV5G2A6_9MICC